MTLPPYSDPVNDEIQEALVAVTRCLRSFVSEYLHCCTIKDNPATITPDEFEQVADDLQALLEAKRLVGAVKDYSADDGEFLDACLAEFLRREEDAADGC